MLRYLYSIYASAVSRIYSYLGTGCVRAYASYGSLIWSSNGAVEDDTLTVMTYNVGVFDQRNTQAVISTILNKYNADVIGLQEIYKTNRPQIFDTAFAAYPYQSIGIQVNKTALVSKRNLASAGAYIFSNQTIEQRGYNKAYVTFNGKNVCIINAHLETTSGGDAKRLQAKEIYDIVKSEPYFVILGDFNTICKDTSHTEYTTIMKQFVDLGCQSANCTPLFGFTNTWTDGTSLSTSESYPCDHIIVSPSLKISELIFDRTKETMETSKKLDHIPIVARIQLA